MKVVLAGSIWSCFKNAFIVVEEVSSWKLAGSICSCFKNAFIVVEEVSSWKLVGLIAAIYAINIY